AALTAGAGAVHALVGPVDRWHAVLDARGPLGVVPGCLSFPGWPVARAATVGRARARPGRTLRARALCQRQRLGLVVELVLRRAALLQPRGRVRAGVGRPMATPRNEAVRAPAACARDRSARGWQRRHDGASPPAQDALVFGDDARRLGAPGRHR